MNHVQFEQGPTKLKVKINLRQFFPAPYQLQHAPNSLSKMTKIPFFSDENNLTQKEGVNKNQNLLSENISDFDIQNTFLNSGNFYPKYIFYFCISYFFVRN